MKASIVVVLLALHCASLGGTHEVPSTVVPAEFLRTEIPGWKRILATPVSADFHAASLREAIQFIFRGTDANYVLKRDESEAEDISAPGSVVQAVPALPTITRKISKLPLRTALFLIAKDTNAIVTWEMERGVPRGIQITFR